MEEISWRQKSRVLWLNAGDRNTKFFHRVASLYRKFNFISYIEMDGTRFDTLPTMKSAIKGFYKSLFTESEAWRPQVDRLLLSQLQATEREFIELPFSEDEVSSALFECCGDKARGPYGMTMAFLQHNWATLRGDVMSMFAEFFSTGKICG